MHRAKQDQVRFVDVLQTFPQTNVSVTADIKMHTKNTFWLPYDVFFAHITFPNNNTACLN